MKLWNLVQNHTLPDPERRYGTKFFSLDLIPVGKRSLLNIYLQYDCTDDYLDSWVSGMISCKERDGLIIDIEIWKFSISLDILGYPAVSWGEI